MVCPYCSTRSVPNAAVCNHCGVILKDIKGARRAGRKPILWRRLLIRSLFYIVMAIVGAALGWISARYAQENVRNYDIIAASVGAAVGIFIVYLATRSRVLVTSLIVNGRRGRVQSQINKIVDKREKLHGDPADQAGNAMARFSQATSNLMEGQVEESIQLFEQAARLGLESRPDYLNNVGVALAQRGQLTLSVERFRQAIEHDGTHAQPRANLLHTLIRSGNKSAVKSALLNQDGMLQKVAEDGVASVIGIAYAVSGAPDDGLPFISKRVAGASRDVAADYRNDIGVVKGTAGKHREAIQEFQAAIASDAGHAAAMANMGVLFLRLKRFDDALDRFQAALTVEPNRGEFHNLLGVALSASGLHNDGIRSFRDARLHAQNSFEANFNLGKVYVEHDLPDQAERYLARAYEINPGSWQILVAQAVLHFKTAAVDRAIATYEEALRLEPEQPMALSGLALCLSLTGQRDQAGEIFARLNRANADVDLLTNYGWYHLLDADIEHAALYTEKALELNKKNPRALNNMGLCEMDMGALEPSSAYFRQALQADPSLTQIHFNLGSAYITMKQVDGAIQQWELAKSAELGNPDLHTNLGVAYFQKNQMEKAAAEFRRVLALRQDRAEDFSNLGLSYAKLKRHTDAIEQFAQAIALDRTNPALHSNMGLACYFANRVEDAMKEWQEVTRLSAQYAKSRGSKQQTEYDETGVDYVPLYITERCLHTTPVVPDYLASFVPGYRASRWDLMMPDELLGELDKLFSRRDRLDRSLRALKL